MQNPILNKKSSRPMFKKYDLFIISSNMKNYVVTTFTTSKVWNGRLQGLTHPFAFCSLSTSLTIVTPWNYKGKPRVHGKILLYLNGIHSTFNFLIKINTRYLETKQVYYTKQHKFITAKKFSFFNCSCLNTTSQYYIYIQWWISRKGSFNFLKSLHLEKRIPGRNNFFNYRHI